MMPTLRDLTSRTAVLNAIAEFDSLERSAFLQKYGFRRARSYFILYNGRCYDSKAITGVALGYQTGTALRGADFVGGDNTVATKLRSLGFEIVQLDPDRQVVPAVKPRWPTECLILLLDFYHKNGGLRLKEMDPISLALVEELHQLDQVLSVNLEATWRSVQAINIKINNFRFFDPKFPNKPDYVIPSREEGEIWRNFEGKTEYLAEMAALIRLALQTEGQHDPFAIATGEMDGVMEAPEGRLLTVRHLRYERSTALAKTKKSRALSQAGRLACEVCNFDFSKRYGPRGHGFIECHHTRPVSELGDRGITRIEDLALICANCHRMIHAQKPWLSIEELIALLT
ncbi:MAG: HNH endonuclease [Janthinobacterium lividum]